MRIRLRPAEAASASYRWTMATLALAFAGMLSISAAAPSGAAKAHSNAGNARLSGYSLSDTRGPFLGLGVSYMSALRHCREDSALLKSNLKLFSRGGFNYIRILSMVGWFPVWEGKEIAPISFRNSRGQVVPSWPDYDDQLGRLLDTAYDRYGLRVQITVFADAQLMPDRLQRKAHLDRLLRVIKGREHKVMLIEIANEAWQNGFPGAEGISEMQEWCRYVKDRTPVLTALSATPGSSIPIIRSLYDRSRADIATVHFTRDTRTEERQWLPVRECWGVARSVGIPVSSNEPIGPGASVDVEDDPVRLVSAAAFAWISGLPMYVFHSSAGVLGADPYERVPAMQAFVHLRRLLPGDLPNWTRHDGSEADLDLRIPCERAADGRLIHRDGTSTGCKYSPSASSGSKFVAVPMGVSDEGLDVTLRTNAEIWISDAISGEQVLHRRSRAGDRVHLRKGSGIYIIRGVRSR